MKSKTLIEKQLKKKNSPELVSTIIDAKKTGENFWVGIASILCSSSRTRSRINLEKINKETKQGEKVVVPGKILSLGELDKKVTIIALSFSKEAIDKIKKSKSEYKYILEEIKENPKAQGLKILK
jgi:large subunit ribosomal protein L18e